MFLENNSWFFIMSIVCWTQLPFVLVLIYWDVCTYHLLCISYDHTWWQLLRFMRGDVVESLALDLYTGIAFCTSRMVWQALFSQYLLGNYLFSPTVHQNKTRTGILSTRWICRVFPWDVWGKQKPHSREWRGTRVVIGTNMEI